MGSTPPTDPQLLINFFVFSGRGRCGLVDFRGQILRPRLMMADWRQQHGDHFEWRDRAELMVAHASFARHLCAANGMCAPRTGIGTGARIFGIGSKNAYNEFERARCRMTRRPRWRLEIGPHLLPSPILWADCTINVFAGWLSAKAGPRLCGRNPELDHGVVYGPCCNMEK